MLPTGSNRLPGNIYLNIEVAVGALAKQITADLVNFTWQGSNLIHLRTNFRQYSGHEFL